MNWPISPLVYKPVLVIMAVIIIAQTGAERLFPNEVSFSNFKPKAAEPVIAANNA